VIAIPHWRIKLLKKDFKVLKVVRETFVCVGAAVGAGAVLVIILEGRVVAVSFGCAVITGRSSGV
jgi:hypothetical protein